jgi:hypothetical protein
LANDNRPLTPYSCSYASGVSPVQLELQYFNQIVDLEIPERLSMKFDSILSMKDMDLALLPNSEDDRHEYKSSRTSDSDLCKKIALASSGFWNSGGGLFVAGVDGHGNADGGITLEVGRQSRRDWIDQAISGVEPRAPYVVHCIENQGGGLNIAKGCGVFLIGFGESHVGPHMAPDNRYYIRAGAHTVSASHFIVEAIHARRGISTPILRHVVRHKPESPTIVQLGIVALGGVPAIDVSIRLDPLPRWLSGPLAGNFSLQVPVISEQFPLFIDIYMMTMNGKQQETFQVKLGFSDLVGRKYDQVLEIDPDRQIGPILDWGMNWPAIERGIGNLKSAVENIAVAIQQQIDR